MGGRANRIGFLTLAGFMVFLGLFSCKNPLVSVIDEEVAVAVTPPEVVSIFPENTEDDVPITLNTITVTLSKYIDPTSVSSSTFYVADSSGHSISGSRQVENESIIFSPNSDLSVGTVYTVTLDGVKDTDGNAISEKYTWSFKTGIEGDRVAPVVDSVTLNDSDTWTTSSVVNVSIEASDNFGVSQMNISFDNSFSESGWTTFRDLFELELPSGEGEKTVYIKIRDGSGNISNLAGSDSIMMDTVLPDVKFFYIDGGNSGTRDSAVTLDLTGEDGDGSSGVYEYRVRRKGDDWPEDWQSLSSEGTAYITDVALPDAVANGDILEFEAQVRDLAGNISETKDALIVFDTSPPTIEMQTPEEGDHNAPYDMSVVTIIFNEEMDLSSFTHQTLYISGPGIPDPPDFQFQFSDYEDVKFSQVKMAGLTMQPESDYVVTLKSTIRDVAGNEFGNNRYWAFSTGLATDTSPPWGSLQPDPTYSGFQSEPAAGELVTILPSGMYATNRTDLRFELIASDDYNSVYAVRSWGESTPYSFEYLSDWELYDPENPSLNWTLGATEKKYNLWFRLQDTRGNTTQDPPNHFAVIYDDSAPTISDVQINNSTEDSFSNLYINDPQRTAVISLAANDVGIDNNEGSGIYQIRLSNDGTFDSEGEDWKDWSPIIPDWQVTDVDGLKTIYIDIQDYLGNNLVVPISIDVILDTAAPVITFDRDESSPDFDIKITNTPVAQTGDYSDNIIADPEGLSYYWEKVSGSGNISFSDSDVMAPIVSADADGNYLLKVQVSDPAGNSSSDTISFVWDETPPDEVGTITVYDQAGNQVTDSAASGLVYTVSPVPSIDWPDSSGADFYRIIFGSPSDPTPPGWDSYDWVTTPAGGWSQADISSISSGEPASAGDNDGEWRMYITAWDKAGNRSNVSSEAYIDFGIDSLAPVITNSGQLISANEAELIDYSLAAEPSGTENAIYDEVPPNAAAGSGIDSITWSQYSGPAGGSLTIDTASNGVRKPVVSASGSSPEGLYEIEVTASDVAGNETSEIIFFEWDVTKPGTPSISGINHTSNQTPVWSWYSGGGGSGKYKWVLEKAEGGTSAAPLNPVYPNDYLAETSGTGLEATSYTLPSGSNDGLVYVLTIQELDRAGNLSDPVSKKIWVDSTYTAVPPPISITGGDATRIIGDSSSVNWTWSTGLSAGGGTYRFKSDNPDLSGTTPSSTASSTKVFSTNGSEDGYHTLYVEEWDGDNSEWVGLVAENTVLIDYTRPSAPSLSGPASPITYSSPGWSWTGEEGSVPNGGTGYFRYRIDGGAWTETSSKSVQLTPGDGSHTFEVQERDQAGNWSFSTSDSVFMDTTPPTLNSVSINSDAGYTNNTTVTYSIDADNESGMQMSLYDYNPAGWKDWEPFSSTKTVYLPEGEGTKYVYVRLMDQYGNICNYKYDTIVLDQTAPENGTVDVNGGAVYTPSLDATMTISATDNYTGQTSLKVQHYYNGFYSSWETFSTNIDFDTTFTKTAGTKTVYVRFMDLAGNESDWYSDSITLQVPSPEYAYKGAYSTGSTYVYYNPVNEPDGSYATRYYIYYTDDPNADPNNGDPVTEVGNSTSTAYSYASGFPKGELLYFFVRAYNSDTGGYGPYSATSVLGFSSNITVIYDDDEAADIERAEYIKELLEDTKYPGGIVAYSSSVSGTMPSWTVTLLPEDLISNTYSSDYSNRIWGDPVIVTSGTSFSSSTTYDGKVRNVAANGRGLIGMNYQGGYFLYRVNQNWSSWGLSGTQPEQIGYGASMTLTATTSGMTRPYSSSEGIWHTPLYHSTLYDSFKESSVNATLFTGNVARLGQYIPSQSVTDGYIYAADSNYSNHFPVVRQGRFAEFGYYEIPDASWLYGQILFINLVARMDNF